MNILIATLGERGHITPFLATAEYLHTAGHTVGWLTEPNLGLSSAELELNDIRSLIEHTGATVLSCEPPAEPPADQVQPDPTQGDMHMMRTNRRQFMHNWMRITLADPSLVEFVARVRAAIRRFQPKVALIDPLTWGFGIVLESDGIPFVSAPTNLEFLLPLELVESLDAWSFDIDLLPQWRRTRAQCFAEFDVHPRFGVYSPLSPWRNVSFTTAEFIGDRGRDVNHMELIGSSLLPDWAIDDQRENEFDGSMLNPDLDLIVVSFGSQVYWQPERICLIAQAVLELPVQLVIGCGELAHTEFVGSLPGDPVVVSWIPQRRLLDRARLFITHGGGNSVAEAHWAGVPMLVLPIDLDQPIQAHFVHESGAGIWLRDIDAEDAVERCREAIIALLDARSSYRKRAMDIRASYRRTNGATRLGDITLQLATAEAT